jgi:HlyD family secretion protein
MVDQKPSLFRKESLERLSSPERLDQLMQVVSPKSWLPLASLSSLVVAALIWSIYGRIPITVEGRGVLIYPRQVVPLQSTGSGQLLTLNIKVGDVVRKGEVLATINQADLQKQLQQQRAKLVELQAQEQVLGSLQVQRNDLEKKAIQQQRQTLQQSLQDTKAVTPILKEKGLEAIRRDRQNVQQRLQAIRELVPTLKQRWESRQRLLTQGAITADQVLQARQEYLNNLASIQEAESQLKQLDVKEADAQRQYLQNLNTIKDLQTQLREQDSKEAGLDQQDIEASTNRKNQIQEVNRTIGQLELQLRDNSQIISKYNGRILEITVAPGQVISPGTRLGSIGAEELSSKLVGVTFFSVEDGKKIKPGMTLQITPQTVKRERFGGIVGNVTTVSAFPITREGAASVVGNPEVVQGLVSDKQTGLLQVYGDLKLDSTTFSGYKWSSSKGPQLKISSGTTTLVRVKVEERAPITYIFPILRSVSGIY